MIFKNVKITDLLYELKDKKVIAVGAGAIGEQFVQFVDVLIQQTVQHRLWTDQIDWLVKDYHTIASDSIIEFFADNDRRKYNSTFKAGDRHFAVYPIEKIAELHQAESKYAIVITSKYFVEIFIQLSQLEALKNMDCYIYPVIREGEYSAYWDQIFKESIYRDNVFNYKQELRKLKDIHKGQRCFIIGNGPSLRLEDLDKLKNEVTFAVNRIYLFFDRTDWRPDYYCVIDNKHLDNSTDEIRNVSAKKKFIPLCIMRDQHKEIEDATYFDFDITPFYPAPPKFSEEISDKIVNGMTVTYVLIQIAVYMGFQEIYLLGQDHSFSRELLPDGSLKYNEGVTNYFQANYSKGDDTPARIEHMNMAYTKARMYCEQHGLNIYNATRGGKLEIFERVDFDSLDFS